MKQKIADRKKKDPKDKRNLYLAREGLIREGSKVRDTDNMDGLDIQRARKRAFYSFVGVILLENIFIKMKCLFPPPRFNVPNPCAGGSNLTGHIPEVS